MMTKIKFFKAVASGNDFIIIDRISTRQSLKSKSQIARLAKQLCQRKLSIGADSLLVIEASKSADFKMRIFNPDETEVDMCGNGSRCVALYAAKKGIASNKMTIETLAGNLHAEVKQELVHPAVSANEGILQSRKSWVKVNMPDPKDLRLKFDLDINGQNQNVNYINTGVPHVVCFVPGVDNFNVQETGRLIRYHPEFQPEGTNADFVEVLDKGHIRVRTYERGVEKETLSCGTGCVAAGIITSCQMEKPQGKHTIKVNTQGGETILIYFNIKNDNVTKVFLEGKAQIVFRGTVLVDSAGLK